MPVSEENRERLHRSVHHATAEGRARIQRLLDHQSQVDAGLIPADSPPTFTLPQPLDERGLPWWFGPDYKPTPEALIEFSRRLL